MLLGKPVVATSVGVSPEIVIPGENGELISSSDPQALAAAILLALEKTNSGGYQPARANDRLERFTDLSSNARAFDDTIEQVTK